MPERPDQRGSTLLLVPSAVLVLFLLAGLTVDGAATFLGQRELADACAGAANDAAAAALDPGGVYGSGGVPPVVDPERTAALARRRVAALEARWGQPVDVRATAGGPDVVLRLGASVPLPIGPAGSARAGLTASCQATVIRR
ncbi:MAG: hypothetical protein ABIS47_06150 [Acidimicrobiales bacterium]